MFVNVARRRGACVAGLTGSLLFVILSPPVRAQGAGELRGAVTDSGGTPMAFALVAATNVETGHVLPAATGTDGRYRFSLPSGEYRIAFESPGYQRVEMPAAKVGALWTVVRNCAFDEDGQSQGNSTVEPAQKAAPSPGSNPQEPSLEDLGITSAQAKGNAQPRRYSTGGHTCSKSINGWG